MPVLFLPVLLWDGIFAICSFYWNVTFSACLKFKPLFSILVFLHSWISSLMKLEVVRELLVGNLESGDRLEALIFSAIYLKVLYVALLLHELFPLTWFQVLLRSSPSYAVDQHRANTLLWRWWSSPSKQACWNFQAYISWIGKNFLYERYFTTGEQ